VFKGQLNIQNVGDLEVRNKLPKPSLRFDVKTIVRACNAFYKPILMKENRMLAERGFLSESWRAGIEALLAGEIGERMNRDGAFLVRVGRHSGAESVTVSGVRKIRIMRGKGQKDEYAASAKTVWLAASDLAQEENMLPFGWLLVEVYPTGDVKLEECEVLKRICDRYTEPVKTWAGKQLQIRRQAAEKLMQRQREQELLAEKQREEAERAARLAAMSLEERVIEKLRALFEEEKATGHKDPAGSLANQRVELLRQAKGWQSPELREKAAGLIEETLQWLDWPKKKREERNREIQELRGNATGGD